MTFDRSPNRFPDRGFGTKQPSHDVRPTSVVGPTSMLIPKDSATLAGPALKHPTHLHPGVMLDRLPERQHVEDQKHQKEHLDRVTKARPWDKEAYDKILNHLVGDNYVVVTARSRIALHLSRAGGLENANCCLHPVYGFAYLPGSGLKGLAHAYAAHLWGSGQVPDGQRDDFAREVEDLFGWAPNRERLDPATPYQPRSGRAEARAPIDAQRGGVIFHDAFGCNHEGYPPNLEVDVCTSHYGPYYQGKSAPGDWLDPVPVTFLTIAAGTKFRIRVTEAHSGVDKDLVEAAKRLLLGGLYWLGAGAKTASGYGAFDEKFEVPEHVLVAEKKAKLEREEKAKVQALDNLWPTSANHALWVPKNVGSNKGFRLTRHDDGTWIYEDGWEFGKNVEAPKNKEQIFLAEINPAAPKRLGNPRLQANVLPPPGRPS